MTRAVSILCLLVGCGAPQVAPEPSPEPTAVSLQGLDVTRALEPLAMRCESIEGPIDERARRADERWDLAAGRLEDGDLDGAVAALMDAYCLLEGHPARADALYSTSGLLMDQARFRAAYEALRLAVEQGSQAFDGFHGYRVMYLRSVLTAAAERIDAGEPPFRLCGRRDEQACAADEECLRDYVRFNDRLCPTTVQLEASCPGVCVPERIVRAEDQ